MRRCVHGLYQLVIAACDRTPLADTHRLRAFHSAVHLQARLCMLADAAELRSLKDGRTSPDGSSASPGSLPAAVHTIGTLLLTINGEIWRRRRAPGAEGSAP